MHPVAPADRDQSLNAIWHALRFGRIVANAKVPTTTYAYDNNGNATQAAVRHRLRLIVRYAQAVANRLPYRK